MTGTIALVMTVLFVLALLRIDRSLFPRGSTAIWIPTIWFIYIGSKPFSYWFPTSGADIDSSPLDRRFLIMLMLLAVFVLIKKHLHLMPTPRLSASLIVLLLFMLASAIWSNDPSLTLARWFRNLAVVPMSYVVLSDSCPREAVECILRRMIYISIPFSFLLVKYYPILGREFNRWTGEEMWIGVAMQKNGLGRLCFISIAFLSWSIYTRRRRLYGPFIKLQFIAEIVLIVIAAWMIKGPGLIARSMTAIVSLVICFITYIGLIVLRNRNKEIAFRSLALIAGAIMIIGILSPFTNGVGIGSLSSHLGRSSTLTGRADVWKMMVPIAMEKPILGCGFGAVYTVSTWNRYMIGEFIVREAHSGYLDVILGIGILGMLLTSWFIYSSYRKVYEELSRDYWWAALGLSIILSCLVHNISESSIYSFANQIPVIILFFSISSTRLNDLPHKAVLA